MDLRHLDLNRLFRAHVEPTYPSFPERWAYVEASDESGASRRIAQAPVGWEYGEVDDVAERISGCQSDDRILRIFEVKRVGNKVTTYVKEPLFLLDCSRCVDVEVGDYSVGQRALSVGQTDSRLGVGSGQDMSFAATATITSRPTTAPTSS